jgi:hypothetical protein
MFAGSPERKPGSDSNDAAARADALSAHGSRPSRIEAQMVPLGKAMLAVRHDAITDAEVTGMLEERVSALSLRVDRMGRRPDLREV